MRFDVRWVAALLVVAGCSQPIETIDSGPGPDTQVDDTDDDTNDDTNDDTDDDSDTEEDSDTEPGFCDLTLSSPAPGTAGGQAGACVTEEIKCGDVIEASNEGGSTHYTKEIYESQACSATENTGHDFDAPERVYFFVHEPNSSATITLEASCTNELKLRALKYMEGDSCIPEGYYLQVCERNYAAGYNQPQVINIDAAENYGFWDVIVDGRDGAMENFKLTVECD